MGQLESWFYIVSVYLYVKYLSITTISLCFHKGLFFLLKILLRLASSLPEECLQMAFPGVNIAIDCRWCLGQGQSLSVEQT